MTEPIERAAACTCGQLRIRTTGAPSIVSSCHCLACQRRTGSLFGAQAFFPRGQIVATEGERSTFRRQAESGAWLAFHFCPKCGSTVFWENERLPDIVSIAVGTFADPHFPPPVRTVWTTTKHDWLAFPDGIVSHPESPANVGSALETRARGLVVAAGIFRSADSSRTEYALATETGLCALLVLVAGDATDADCAGNLAVDHDRHPAR